MKRFLLIVILFSNAYFALAQINPFYQVSGLNTTLFPCIFIDRACDCIIYRSDNYYNEHINTISDFYPFCDSIKSINIQHYFEFFYKYTPFMNNLQYIYINGYLPKNKFKQFSIPSRIEYLWLDYTELPLLVDYNQYKTSLKVLSIEFEKYFSWKNKTNYHLNFSEFDSLKYLSLELPSKNSSYILITFPPNLYHLEWSVLPAHINTPIPKSVEIMYLIIQDNVFPLELFQLPNLKYLCIYNWTGKPIKLPDSLPSIISLRSLEIESFTEQDVKIISQMSQLDTMILINAQGILPSNISLLKNIKHFKFGEFCDPNIVTQIQTLFPKSSVVFDKK